MECGHHTILYTRNTPINSASYHHLSCKIHTQGLSLPSGNMLKLYYFERGLAPLLLLLDVLVWLPKAEREIDIQMN